MLGLVVQGWTVSSFPDPSLGVRLARQGPSNAACLGQHRTEGVLREGFLEEGFSMVLIPGPTQQRAIQRSCRRRGCLNTSWGTWAPSPVTGTSASPD